MAGTAPRGLFGRATCPCVSRLPRHFTPGVFLLVRTRSRVYGCIQGRDAGRTFPLRRCLAYVTALPDVCETRKGGLLEQTFDALLRRHGPMARPSSASNKQELNVTLTNVCIGRPWNGLITKVEAYYEYAQSAPPAELLICSDSDAIFNVIESADALMKRFEAALLHQPRGRIVYQGEPICWAPWGDRKKFVPKEMTCSMQVLAQYEELGHHRLPWRCPRYLNSGGFAGLARDMTPHLQRWLAGMVGKRKVGSAWPGPPPVCRKELVNNKIGLGSLEDQCVATNLMLRSNGTIVLDSHEHLFASGSIVVGRNDSGQTYATRAGGIICGPDKCLLGTRFTSSWSWSKDDRWRRLGPYSKECAIAQDSGPTLIHFNGVSKRFVSDPKSPLQRCLSYARCAANESGSQSSKRDLVRDRQGNVYCQLCTRR